MTNWPSDSTFEVPYSEDGENAWHLSDQTLKVWTLNNVEVVRIMNGESEWVQMNLPTLSNLITVLQYAEWYLKEGKYQA